MANRPWDLMAINKRVKITQQVSHSKVLGLP